MSVGVTVRFKGPAVYLPTEPGIVVRLDARGALVKLDSGREYLVDPAMLQVIT